jgi:hypothetical protein
MWLCALMKLPTIGAVTLDRAAARYQRLAHRARVAAGFETDV